MSLLLALDAGNTNVTIGAFDGDRLISRWRLSTVRDQTADEWGVLLRNLFALDGHNFADIGRIVIASVVPPIDEALAAMSHRYFRKEPLFVRHTTDTGLRIRYDNPAEVGADRIVNGVAAYHRLGGPCVVVDLGTAITFDAISREADYLGGIIAPGIGIAINGLVTRTARLPLVSFQDPGRLIGTNTVASMQSGLYYGTIALIDGILEKLIAELGPDTKTLATGGQAHLVVNDSQHLKMVDEDLTLIGLRLIAQRHA